MLLSLDLAGSRTKSGRGRLRALLAVALPVIALAGSPAADAAAGSLRVRPAKPLAGGPLSPAQKQVLRQGYLVPNQGSYDRAKARAARRAPRSASAGAAAFAVQAPVANPSFAGLRDTNVGPDRKST